MSVIQLRYRSTRVLAAALGKTTRLDSYARFETHFRRDRREQNAKTRQNVAKRVGIDKDDDTAPYPVKTCLART